MYRAAMLIFDWGPGDIVVVTREPANRHIRRCGTIGTYDLVLVKH
jgi:hypothetical protein